MKCRVTFLLLFFCVRLFPQSQTCPANISFASGDLTHWYAFTGNNRDGNGSGAIFQKYDSIYRSPSGTLGTHSIQEYNYPTVQGIQVNTFNTKDPFGNFPVIPTINGYNYQYSIRLGSTTITRSGPDGGNGGGYIRGVSYSIRVPPGPATEPYTMTYAYAMVLENGTHRSVEQPHMSATVITPAGVFECASPSYLLPTFNNTSSQGRGATLDSATALKNGFTVSTEHSPNRNPDPSSGTEYLQDVWIKGWTEVTFDLAAFRGQQVSITFEADNCIPGGHFAYGYIAIRNNCAGLQISGDSLVCNNTIITYSVPALANAKYDWTVPDDWTIVSGDTTNILQVKSSANGGTVSVHEQNSCADLSNKIPIKTLPSPEAGVLKGSTAVCAGENNSALNLTGYSGTIIKWLYSTDSVNYSDISNFNDQFAARDLNTTTFYKVVVGKGDICPSDTSSIAVVAVDQKTIGGKLDPANGTLCLGQSGGALLKLTGNRGTVVNWQFSTDEANWTDFNPIIKDSFFTAKGITTNTSYRLIDQNGTCPPDTSAVASILFNPVSFPEATVFPVDTTICYGTAAMLLADIKIGTSFSWNPAAGGIGNVDEIPFHLSSQVYPPKSGDYVLYILNKGCPNPLLDTAHINVLPPVIVDAGHDTSVVVGEPLQFHAISDDAGPDSFLWTPATKLNNAADPDPVAIYDLMDNIIRYTVQATTPFGCRGEGFVTVKVFKTRPDIFVPNAFTPGGLSNTLFRPVPVGISSLEYFRVYNRLGQLVFSTSTLGHGWDGMLNGTPQSSGGYVWMVRGIDYTGNVITKTGTMVLVR